MQCRYFVVFKAYRLITFIWVIFPPTVSLYLSSMKISAVIKQPLLVLICITEAGHPFISICSNHKERMRGDHAQTRFISLLQSTCAYGNAYCHTHVFSTILFKILPAITSASIHPLYFAPYNLSNWGTTLLIGWIWKITVKTLLMLNALFSPKSLDNGLYE